MFTGQGSQRKGMGAGLLERYPEHCATADRVLGRSVRELCLQDPDGLLGLTRYAQPALFVVNALGCLAAREEGAAPDFLAGHSLGEYVALFAAGCFDFETGVRLVARRGELMGEAGGGGMAAVVGLAAEQVAALLADGGLTEVDIANHNSATQVVVAGPAEAIPAVRELVRRHGTGRCVPLNVGTAFHSRHMADAARRFARFLVGFRLADPQLPVISNVTAEPYRPGTVAELLGRQIDSPVRWRESMHELLRQGVSELREIGPAPVLTAFWETARNEPRLPARSAAPPPPAASAPLRSPAVPDRGAADPDPGAAALGSAEFRRDYGLRYAYLAGGMFRGVASTALVVRLARAGLMGYFGAGGLAAPDVRRGLGTIRAELGADGAFGVNVLHSIDEPGPEERLVDLCLEYGVRFVEAAAFTGVTPALVRFRFTGAHRDADGRPTAVRHVLAKVSRPEVAAEFLAPAPEAVVARLVAAGGLTREEGEVARLLPVSADLCVEADSGGHTDGGVALTLVPSLGRLRDELAARYGYPERVRVGAAGGLGSPEAVAAAFMLGADFVVTGSVNQCTPEADTSDAVKDLLATLDVQDTAYAPAGDLFELGARVQVVRKGTLFAARANRLHQLYRQHGSLAELDEATRRSLERTCFRRPLEQVWKETREYFLGIGRTDQVERAERDPKHLMALVFRSYFARSNSAARAGDPAERANYQIHSGPAIGAFNRLVHGTELADWRARHVDAVAELLMRGAARTVRERFAALARD
ncbi:ACP S-malonyltransferase [Saccharothrix sp. ST-888]|uniref:ACP S-malonyltransferase n=1 Tax=Saccharothrix sp. ST-888 TaxID=1427391 RepID=UPI001E36EFE8|nr:ACP S-malonyltransferase [Saccharothrix sp. ST-888]